MNEERIYEEIEGDSDKQTVDASPTKGFFIFMITRDIYIRPAIVELIDNAIDGAKRVCPDGNYEGKKVEILFDSEKFIIRDNCGGIGIETATKYAFKFGRPDERPDEGGQLFTGVFGIGMKRALFKLGRHFTVKSTTSIDSFTVDVDVDEWIKDQKNWTFPITVENKEGLECGTEIVVEKLNKESKLRFGTQTFENELISYIEKYRSVETEKGLEIYVNEKLITTAKESIIENESIVPYKSIIEDKDGIIRIVAGITHYGKPQNAGWYIYCNGRLVLYADKTETTGWGNDYRSYHPSLAAFRGYVFFESSNLLALPWNTTKTGVDNLNRLYVLAREKMKEAAQQVFRAIDDAKKKMDVDSESFEELPFVKGAKEINMNYSYLSSIKTTSDFKIIQPEERPRIARISFTKLAEDVEKVQKHIGASSRKELGEKLFQYYVEMENI